MEIQDNNILQGEYISLGRNGQGNNIYEGANWNSRTNDRKGFSLVNFLFLFTVLAAILILIKTPLKARVELGRDTLDKSLKKRLNSDKFDNTEQNTTLELDGIRQTGNKKHDGIKLGSINEQLNKTKLFDSKEAISNFTGEIKDKIEEISSSIKNGFENFQINSGDTIFGSRYTIQGINRRAVDSNICEDKNYTKKVLKLVYELSYFALPKDIMNINKFEASDVKVFDDKLWIVCDNVWHIGKFGLSLTPFSHYNKLLDIRRTTPGGNPFDIKKLLLGTDPDKEDSQFEAIVRDDYTGHFFVIRESIPHEITNFNNKYLKESSHSLKNTSYSENYTVRERHYHSHIIELAIVDVNNVESYEVLETCTAEHKFEFDNKGFEGAVGLRTRSGEFYLLGLCEGNYCMGESKGEEYGNGRLILMKKVYIELGNDKDEERSLELVNLNSRCIWKSVRMINIPKEANFQDYSSIDIRGNKVAVTSQEDSSLWIGEINYGDGEFLDPEKFELLPNGKVFYFPRDHACDFKYCNIEGVSFISDNLIATVSDKMKKNNRQSPKCIHKDQSIHIFSIP
ncbi:hypothetical protein FG386_000075 [Cryptosporidium ryanae]|uniref:uncharacterized protein n=1 Tax=Cryptosporidium ryanae TaxID=515981 RepID=UPI003519DCDF|nr:hypothetical protein FG386_000075 [Cryptosporidium ryanae]